MPQRPQQKRQTLCLMHCAREQNTAFPREGVEEVDEVDVFVFVRDEDVALLEVLDGLVGGAGDADADGVVQGGAGEVVEFGVHCGGEEHGVPLAGEDLEDFVENTGDR